MKNLLDYKSDNTQERKTMKVILKQQVKKVGEKNEVCEVKDGYARNFLIPNKMAIIASKANLAELKEIQEKKEKAKKIPKTKAKAKKAKKKVKKTKKVKEIKK